MQQAFSTRSRLPLLSAAVSVLLFGTGASSPTAPRGTSGARVEIRRTAVAPVVSRSRRDRTQRFELRPEQTDDWFCRYVSSYFCMNTSSGISSAPAVPGQSRQRVRG